MDQPFETARAAEQVSKFLSSERDALDRVELRQKLLAMMLSAGYDRARFYERCADVGSEKEHVLVMVAEAENDGPPRESHLAKCIPVAEIGYDEQDDQTVFPREAADFDPEPDWIEEFDLTDRAWVDVNLRVLGESVGAIAVDWAGRKDRLTGTDARLLAGIGTMIAQHIQIRSPYRVQRFRQAITGAGATEAEHRSSPVSALLQGALVEIAEILDARLAALFEYRWSTGMLQKTFEYDPTRGRERWDANRIAVLPEEYEVGQNLTGFAWVDPSYRHVPNFSRAEHLLRPLISEKSYSKHTAYMGGQPTTCLYGRVESMEPRYMIRLMNRGKKSEAVPYVGERFMLQEFLVELRAAVDKATALGRTSNLEYATRLAANNTDPGAMLTALAPLLKNEDVDDAIVLCHRRQSDQFCFRGAHGDTLAEKGHDDFIEWRTDGLYRTLIERAEDVQFVDMHTLRRNMNDSPTAARIMRKDRFAGALAIQLSAGDTAGLLFVPLRRGSRVRKKTLIDDCGIGRLGLLKAYGSLLVDIVDSSVARARADGAKRALGVLGHELSTPLAQMGSAAELALTEIRKVASGVQRSHVKSDAESIEPIDSIQQTAVGYREQIRGELRSIGASISLAPLVAQESADGRLEMQMRRCNLGELTLRAMAQASQEATDHARDTIADKQSDVPTYRFRRKDSVLEVGTIVGDPGFLYLAILNVMRNAYKYSIPTPRSTLCEIEVSAQRQTGMKIIVVENTGRGVNPELVDLIFEPWVRLADDRDATARPGMGIGLFFSRRIAIAHSGTVICTGSTPVSDRVASSRDDPHLDRMLRGAQITDRHSRWRETLLNDSATSSPKRYTTRFEIRLDTNLEPGAYVHEWAPGYVAAKTRRR